MTLRELECPPLPRLEGIKKIHRERRVLRESFLDTVRCFAHLPGTVALMSGGDHDCASYHILGVFPWLSLRSKSTALEITKQGDTRRLHQDPFDVLEQLLDRYRAQPVDESVPIQAGLFGYLAYDLKDHLEQLPRTSVDDLGLPDLYMVVPSLLLVQACKTGETVLFVPEFQGEPSGEVTRRLARFEAALNQPPQVQHRRGADAAFSSGFSRDEYMQAVEAIKRYIAQGDVYQVNMSQRFAGNFAGDPFELYTEMYQANPAAFFAYVNAGDHQVVSTSPERFIRLEGGLVETRPIKGTRPRGASVEEDRRLRDELEGSKKDEAELSMIVDLLRNDIGKVCRPGSVRVAAHKHIEGYKNVYHLVSVVEGALDEGQGPIDLIRATFPGGSITGCPKIRSMEIIDEL
ncbi:MAG TPA: anthranilate synthase component I family protein, partial [Polyangiaceae bacterium]|nr:anthranilate synthase component I family protein [Polyangiaceae bacterium]